MTVMKDIMEIAKYAVHERESNLYKGIPIEYLSFVQNEMQKTGKWRYRFRGGPRRQRKYIGLSYPYTDVNKTQTYTIYLECLKAEAKTFSIYLR